MLMDEWIKDVKKKGGVDTDGAYGKQCMDLYNDYCHRVLGISGKTGAACAKEILNNSYVMKHFQKIRNYLEFVPEKGDIAVWTGGTYGHVAMVLKRGNINTFKTIDQNWVSQKLTEETHNYTYMAPLYFLRPLDQSNISPKVETTKTEKVEETKEEKVEEPKVEIKEEVKEEKTEVKTEEKVEEKKTITTISKNTQEKNILVRIIKIIFDFITKMFNEKSK